MTLSKGNRLAKLKQVWNDERKAYDTPEPKEIVSGEMAYDYEVADLSASSYEYDPATKTQNETVFAKLKKIS